MFQENVLRVKHLFERVRRRTPESVKALARNPFVRWMSAFLDPRLQSGFLWTIEGGLLDGLRIDIGNPGQHHMVANPYEPRMQAVLSRLVKPGMVCADIGAHIGYMSLVIAKLAGPEGTVFAFEPDATSASLIERNRALNPGLAPIVVVRAAATDGSSKSVNLFAGLAPSQNSLLRGRGTGTTSSTVAAVALDHFFCDKDVPRVLKIDVEGAEQQVVQGMSQILAGTKPTIVMEVHGLDGWSALEFLKAAEYSLEDLEGLPFDASNPKNEIFHVVATPR